MTASARFEPGPPARHVVALMVTRRCNMTCGHCSVASGPEVKGEPAESDLLDWTRQAAHAGVRSIRITGGEPMLRPDVVRAIAREARALGVSTAINTNGFWGYSLARARKQVRLLKRAGLGAITVSFDRYHAEFQGPGPALNLAKAAQEQSLHVNFNVVRGANDEALTSIADRLEPARGTRLRVYELQLVGRAQGLPAGSVRDDAAGFCTSCSYPAITDDGRLIACTGPAYFEKPGSPLVIGSLRETPLAALLERHRSDPVLSMIRARGPAGLRDELRRLPGFEAFPFRATYFGICELCHHITSDPLAVAALRQRLMQPDKRAELWAAWQVIEGNRQHGELTAAHVNGAGACRVFLRAASQPSLPLDDDGGRVLGHAHLDWRMLADYLAGSGLSRRLQPALADPQLVRWAPEFFRSQLSRQAMRDGLRELVQRDAIAHIAEALRELGGQGVLLKGAAFLMTSGEGAVSRATSDVDVLVPPELAPRLRARLLADGFAEAATAGPGTEHHLAAVYWQGVAIELHTRIMQASWRLPEAAMVADARPLAGSEVLFTLGPEAQVLHALVHLSASFFSFGLKTAWDIRTVLERSPGFDWEKLAMWAATLGAPRAFWIPLAVLADGLRLPVPGEALRRVPRDPGARRLEAVVRSRIFRATEGLFDLDVVTKTGLILLVHDRVWGRVHYLASQARARLLRPGTWRGAAERARRAGVVRQSWRQFQRYRRAVASAAPVDDAE